LKDRFGLKAEVKVGQTGDFEVKLNGGAIFSKRKLSRFPNDGEVEELVEGALSD